MFDQMVAHASEEFPDEACGVIAARDGCPVRMYPVRNAEESPVVYRFDEREHLAVFNEVEDRGLDLLGFWHSHPNSEAYPSPTDRARAHWQDPVGDEEVVAYPGTAYLILSLQHRANPVIRAFRFEDGAPVEEEVRIS
jgi:[CysO sulfur-carrier protein]-S-L-cysteine hydrolase